MQKCGYCSAILNAGGSCYCPASRINGAADRLAMARSLAEMRVNELNTLASFAGMPVRFYHNIVMYNVVIWQVFEPTGATTMFEVVGSNPNA